VAWAHVRPVRLELRQVGVGLTGRQGVLRTQEVLRDESGRAASLAAPLAIGRPEAREKPVESAHVFPTPHQPWLVPSGPICNQTRERRIEWVGA
jgi:hypothetical protein